MPSVGEQPGLRLRLGHEARRIAAQHEYLGALLATVERAVARGSDVEAREAINALIGGLEAHFSLEEHVHFPALHGLDPALGAEIAALGQEHGTLRRELAELRRQVTEGASPALCRRLEAFASTLRPHEEREERLLAAVASES
jgi:iron-sulfur cluster repair protein YtfE (RIC family)